MYPQHNNFLKSSTNRIAVQAGWGIKQEFISKNIHVEIDGRMAQVVQCLPSKPYTLSSNTSATKKIKERRKKKKETFSQN
jgi:hypothetical protein